MDRPITTLFLLSSVDGKISTGATEELDVDKDFPKLAGVCEGLHQYYEIEQTTDLWSLNSGRVQAKMGVNHKEMPNKTMVSFVLVDNKWLTNTGEMTRDNCTGWLFENLDGMGNNAKIVADVAGDYVFVWSIADSKLSVTYPMAGEEPVDPETAVDDVTVGVKAVKVIRNGQMYIIRDGVIYNAMGQIAE